MNREAFEAWGKQHNITFVSRSHGQATTDTISRDALMALWQAARAAALDEAAAACEAEAELWEGVEARLCAARIRALKEKG